MEICAVEVNLIVKTSWWNWNTWLLCISLNSVKAKLWEVLLQSFLSSASFRCPLSSLQGLWMLLFSWWSDDEDTPCHAYKSTCPLPLMSKPFDSTWLSSLPYHIFSVHALILMPSISFLFIAFKVVWLGEKASCFSTASRLVSPSPCFPIQFKTWHVWVVPNLH